MAILIKDTGERTEVHPKEGRVFSLEELQAFVEGEIEVVPLPDGRDMYLNEYGKTEPHINTRPNREATQILREVGGIPGDIVMGNVLLTAPEETGDEAYQRLPSTRRRIADYPDGQMRGESFLDMRRQAYLQQHLGSRLTISKEMLQKGEAWIPCPICSVKSPGQIVEKDGKVEVTLDVEAARCPCIIGQAEFVASTLKDYVRKR